ncbi:MAG: HlyD family type I secretion periplasmic adaptor subunit [Rhodospirillaceae bacterium]|nr:HlyD family type I secretion periplasmic adaptor subunit [Rhodospirillaceae bacterium]MBT3626745.1 HlyD family type I secretion periplasmic adaptor subunit [Rhodospirillaceae bacterium]MBT3927439.1 HlyD family type I secretion periplasmic adaptor subunit [Rhodospirillaceae bacterium]MBT5037498.1 HlyD family type I secretion periplasmic adaptor subunit [Rhodospirillaceae bacterium]MBT5674766.1 HlyD family type I secretion periplasmic adaptor subunit [Rhodospirillaceae bacterium]
MNRLDGLEKKAGARGWRRTALLVTLTIAALIAWANFAELEEVAVASGEVVPQGQVKVIQHLEGGIISQIFVAEGDSVEAGDLLLQLDRGISGSNRDEVQIELDSLILARARLVAESQGTVLVFPDNEAERRPELVQAERHTYEGHKLELQSTVAVLHEQMRQRELDVSQIRAQLNSTKNNLALTLERFVMSEDLLAEGLTPKIEHVQIKQEVEKLQGEMEELKSAIPRAEASITEAKARLNEEKLRATRVALEELSDVQRRIAGAREKLNRATDQVVRTEISSPIAGVVQTMRHHTIGGVARPGEPLMEIVPTQERMVVEAKLNPTDIGYVRVGQSSVVKVSTYDFSRYGGLDGHIVSISPDSHVDSNTGKSYFRVIAETDKNYLGANPGELPIAPGMEATLDIHTGSKTVMQYLLKPVVKVKSEAFRER